MTRFRFRLENALAWRQTQLRIEERELERALAGLANTLAGAAEIEAARAEAGRALVEAGSITGAELSVHAAWRAALHRRALSLAAERSAGETKVAAHRARVIDASRKVRLLDRLRERRLAEWNYQAQRELENFAADAHLSRRPPD